jgi:single-strand DNA-binding protein
MNNITIAGQLGRDAEVRFLSNGDPVALFSVADSQGKGKATIWWRCSLFGKRAQSLAPYLMKGQSVTVSGNVTQREYEQDGVKKTSMEIRVNDVALQGGKPQQSEPSRPAAAPAQGGAKVPSGFDEDDSDIPFITASMASDPMMGNRKAKRAQVV